MKTPITLDDPRLTAYALGDLVEPGDVETIEAALKESPELQAYVDEIRDLGETLTLEFANETVPEEEPTVVSPKRSVWRYVAPLGIAATIALVATQLVKTSERADVSPELAAASERAPDESGYDKQALRQDYVDARARMHELAQRHRINDTELAAPERPELPNGSVISLPVRPMTGSMELDVSRKEMNRQLTEYREAKDVYVELAALLGEPVASQDLVAQVEASKEPAATPELDVEELTPVQQLEMQRSVLADLEGEELVAEALRLGTSDPTLVSLGRRLEEIRTKKVELDVRYLERHPKIRGWQREIADTQEMLVSAAEAYRTTLNTTLNTKLLMADQALALAKEIQEPPMVAGSGGAAREAEVGFDQALAMNSDRFGIGMEEAGDVRGANAKVSRARVRKANPGKRRVILAPGKRPQFASGSELLEMPGRPDDLSSAVSGESYASTSDNAFKEIVNPGDERATFSTDVDTASYSNVRRFLNNGQLPPKNAVRVEEMINYFHYDYPQPEGEHPFSVNLEVNEAPWKSGHRLLRIGLKAKDVMVDKRPDSNLVFLVDVSGSMNSYDKLPLLKESLKAMVGGLTERDLVSLVTYAGQSKVHLPPTPGHETSRLIAAIDQLQSGGSTNGASGIQMAYEQASKHRLANGVNRVLLATDGDFNVGVTDTDELIAMAKKRAKEDQVFLTVLGFGQGNVQDDRMEQLANKVDGAYHYIDTEREGRKVLVDEMSATLVPIAKDVKIQVEFNPAKVKSYRLIGYANRLLANRDFTDDKKDAGDMGAGHTVTAFYEVVLTGHESLGRDAAPLKYRRAKAVEPELEDVSADLVTVRLRYKEPKEDTSQEFETSLQDDGKAWNQASEDFRFAASVAAFGMVIRQSPYCAASLSTISHWAKESLTGDEYGWRAECVQLIEKAMKL